MNIWNAGARLMVVLTLGCGGGGGGEGLAGEVLHREVEPAGVLADEVDVRDVRVDDAGLRAGLAHEALAELRIAGERLGEHLHGDGAIEREVGREVDLAHAAGAEAALDAEVAELAAGGEI